MHIGLLFDLQTDPNDERQAEFDPPQTIDALRRALESLGHHLTPINGVRELLRLGPKGCCSFDLVFNLAEGMDGRCREAWAPTLLDLFGIPYVGSDALALSLGLDKVMAKRLAKEAGVLTPAWQEFAAGAAVGPVSLRFPVIVKPRWEGSGRGIDAGAVVTSQEALAQRVAWLTTRYPGPILLEEFVPAGELTVCLIGNEPPAAYPAIQRPLDPATRLSCHVVKPAPAAVINPLELGPALEQGARDAALTIFRLIGCQDMARVDFRVDEQQRVWFLEINPLPSFDPAGSFGLLAEYLGVSYANVIGRILDAAVRRLQGASAHAKL